jgi:TetR/AcrR family transcriptional regulator
MAESADVRSNSPQPRAAQTARGEQRRATISRTSILEGAVAEFARKGFDGASMRSIALRSGVPHALITYHFQTKDLLWRAAAERAFDQIRASWDVEENPDAGPLERLRLEYGALFRFTVAFPEFHRFIDQETDRGNPRLVWVAENVVRPLIERLLPQIEQAQMVGMLPSVEPILFHYMMVSLSSTLARFGPEMELTSGVDPDGGETTTKFWDLVERLVFAGRAGRSATDADDRGAQRVATNP